jgi:hypothetical protein
MHSLPDIIGGIFLGIVALSCWLLGGFDAVEYWVENGSYGELVHFYLTKTIQCRWLPS